MFNSREQIDDKHNLVYAEVREQSQYARDYVNRIHDKNTTSNNLCQDVDKSEKNMSHTCVGYVSSSLLTNYKKDVDISKYPIKHYGLTENDLISVKSKLQKQKQFLDNNFLYDKSTCTSIPLSKIIVSTYHNPHRYYGEIQNRINTLTQIANEKGLKPVFMTLTLPSEYHPKKTIRLKNKKTKLIHNSRFNGSTPKESIKVLTRMFARLRHDRALKDLSRNDRDYFRVNEPHRDGTPHTHVLMFLPEDRIQRVIKAFKRLFDTRANDIQKITDKIENATAYIMKYINKTLPLSKQKDLTEKDEYLNAWYSHNRVIRFNSSRSLAPMSLYRLVRHRFSLYATTMLRRYQKRLTVWSCTETDRIMEVFFGDEIVYMRNTSFEIKNYEI